MGKITGYGALSSPAADDLLVIVDVSDTTMASTGTDKKVTAGDLVDALALSGSFGVPSAKLAPKVVTLADAATIAVDASLGNDFRVTLGGNRTMGAPSNPADGQSVTFELVQDATGSRTVTWNAAYHFGSGSAPTLSTAANSVDLVAFRYSAGKAAWLALGSALGF